MSIGKDTILSLLDFQSRQLEGVRQLIAEDTHKNISQVTVQYKNHASHPLAIEGTELNHYLSGYAKFFKF